MRLTASRVYTRPPPTPKMPPGLVELMEGLTRDVLKNNPPDVYEFCASHMQKLLEIRDGPPATKRPLTLEEKIARVQQKMRESAERRRKKYDRDMKMQAKNEETAPAGETKSDIEDIEQVLVSPVTEGIFKAPVHHEQDLTDALEVEIYHKSDSVNNEDTTHENLTTDIKDKRDVPVNDENRDMNVVETGPVFDEREHAEPNEKSVATTSATILPEKSFDSDMIRVTSNSKSDEAIVTEDEIAESFTDTLIDRARSLDTNIDKELSESSVKTEPAMVVNKEKNSEDLKLPEDSGEGAEMNVVSGNLTDNDQDNNVELDTVTTSFANEIDENSLENTIENEVKKITLAEETNDVSNKSNDNVWKKHANAGSSDIIETQSSEENNITSKIAGAKKSYEPNAEVKTDHSKPSGTVNVDTNALKRELRVPEEKEKPIESKTESTEHANNKIAMKGNENSVRSTEIDTKDTMSVHLNISDGAITEDKVLIVEAGFKDDNTSIPEQDSKHNGELKIVQGNLILDTLIEETDKDSSRAESGKPSKLLNDVERDVLEISKRDLENISEGIENPSSTTDLGKSDNDSASIGKSSSLDDSAPEDGNDSTIGSDSKNGKSSAMDLETAAITIQKVFRNFLFKSRASTFEDSMNDDNQLTDEPDEDIQKVDAEFLMSSSNLKERRGITRMDTVLQTVNEEKSLSLSTDDSSLSSAATIIQAHVRGFLVRNRRNSNTTNSLVNSDGPSTSLGNDIDHNKPNKTVLNIIVPEGGHFISRDESVLTSMELSLDGSPPSSMNLHPLGYDKSEPRKQLKRGDAIQSISPPSNNSGKLSEDIESIKDMTNDSMELPSVEGLVDGIKQDGEIPTNANNLVNNTNQNHDTRISNPSLTKLGASVDDLKAERKETSSFPTKAEDLLDETKQEIDVKNGDITLKNERSVVEDLKLDSGSPDNVVTIQISDEKQDKQVELQDITLAKVGSTIGSIKQDLYDDLAKKGNLVNEDVDTEKSGNIEKFNNFVDDVKQNIDVESRETTPTQSTTFETVIDARRLKEESKDVCERNLTKMSSDESDVVTPYEDKNSTDSDITSGLLHSGEFHDVVLPTKISRSDTAVAREFKNVLAYFLIWNSS